jgi:hypothetical protein
MFMLPESMEFTFGWWNEVLHDFRRKVDAVTEQ